ncbi:MAG: hypothetical protein K2X81_02200, partial [Candidatus Obscuribacterales bacterium]|nr:hypothetical protein [Candidatus Obscuribacterales bacterium]
LTLLYCVKRNYFMNTKEKLALSVLMQSTMWVSVIRQLTFKDWNPSSLLHVDLPFWAVFPDWLVHVAELSALLSALAFVFVVARKWYLEHQLLPLPAALLTVTGVVMFLAGKQISETFWLFVPAFFHASQYIAISLAIYLKEKGLPQGVSPRQIGELVTEPAALRYYALLLACGLAFFQVLPFVAALLGLDKIAFTASMFAAIHFHHFLTDSAIWKLRDPEVRKLMLA